MILLALVGACSDGDGTVSKPETAKLNTVRHAVTGNMHPDAIQIDGPTDGADLYADVGTPLNAGAGKDWVADSNPNSGTGCLGSDAIATCIEAGVTGAANGTGHWNGVRIVDGIASNDQDIFLSGGKENEFQTWNIGPKSVGSSKYDIVQAYLANNQSTLFFGMERRGVNGTTWFDFEFNQLAPGALETCPQSTIIPCRSNGDVLFTFEMQGAGGPATAVPHIFTWQNDNEFVEGAPEGIVSSINDSETTASGPWGHVDAHGNWVLGDLARFSFAEAAAPISLLPGINACGGSAYVQVRTRSSVSETSDMKDTTKIFEFQFLNLSATASLTPSCDQGFGYSATGSDADGNPIANPTCQWKFSNGATSDTCSGFLSAEPGTYTATLELSDPNVPGCLVSVTTGEVHVYPPLGVSASLSATCDNSFNYSATPSGGSNADGVSYAWAFSGGSTTPSTSTSQSGSATVGAPGVPYTGSVIITDPRTDIVCTASAEASATPYAPLSVDLVPSADGASCPAILTDAITYNAVASGGDGNYSYTWIGAACSGMSCEINPDDSTYCHAQILSATVSDGSGLCSAATSEEEVYTKVTTVAASNNP